MSRPFDDVMREVAQEARREGRAAVAELEAFETHFRIAGELLALRKRSGLTQRRLAELTGVHQSEISRIEAAGSNPTLSTLSVLARALGAEFSIRARKGAATGRSSPARRASGRRSATAGAARRVSAPAGRRARTGRRAR